MANAPFLTANPNPIVFNQIPKGSTDFMLVVITNSGTAAASLLGINFLNTNPPFGTVTQFTATDLSGNALVFPLNIAAGASLSILVKASFPAQGNATASFSANMMFVPNLGNYPAVIVTASFVFPATPTLVVGPDQYQFPNTQIGVASAEALFSLRALFGNVTVITIVVSGSPLSLGPTQPTLPLLVTPLGGNTILDGTSPHFGIIFTPAVGGMTTGTVTITHTGSNTPLVITIGGNGIQLVSAFPVTGATRGLLLGYTDGTTQSEFQVDPTNLNCEEPGSFSRVHDFGKPTYEKVLERLFFRYENLGAANLSATFLTTRQTVTQKIAIGNASADGLLYDALFDRVIRDELITVLFTRLASDGPISLTHLFPEVEFVGEFVEGT